MSVHFESSAVFSSLSVFQIVKAAPYHYEEAAVAERDRINYDEKVSLETARAGLGNA